MTALLLELVELQVMIAPQTSSSEGATGQRKHPGDWQSLLVAATIFLLSLKLLTRSATNLSSRELLDCDVTALTGHALQTKSSRK